MQVCRLTSDRLRLKMERIGLHRAQGFAMFHLWHRDGVAQSELAKCIHVTPAAVTVMLQRMERNGWIERRTDPNDQRITRVYMTEKARTLHLEAMGSFRELDAEVAGALSAEERDALRELLLKVYARFLEHMAPRHQHRFGWHPDEEEEEETA